MKMKVVKIVSSLIILMTHSYGWAVNSYVADFGVSKIISAKQSYPNFTQSPPLQNLHPNATILVVITSTKELKINSTKDFFSNDPAFKDAKVSYNGAKVASDVAEQPVGLKNGILGAENRIKNAKALQQQRYINSRLDIYYVSIENFISELPPVGDPTDHALVVIEDPAGTKYTYLSDGVEISRSIYEIVITPGNMTADHTGTKTTIGEYLAFMYKVDHTNWFAYVTDSPYNRVEQIATAFHYASSNN
jgi:non-canonical (house-cleaning) NTP pyrophosphatase